METMSYSGEQRKIYERLRYANNPKVRERQHSRYVKNADKIKARHRIIGKAYRQNRKLEVLTHYGKNGRLQCCWQDCEINDPDLLTIDHIQNDGGCQRRNGQGLGLKLYTDLRKRNYPDGFQTLCWNHQMKKEILRRRAAVPVMKWIGIRIQKVEDLIGKQSAQK